MLNELGRSITDFVESVQEFGLTGDIKYKKLYGKKLSAVYKSFGIINAKTEHRADLQLISLKFQDILELSRTIMSRPDEVRTPEMLERIKNIEVAALEIIFEN